MGLYQLRQDDVARRNNFSVFFSYPMMIGNLLLLLNPYKELVIEVLIEIPKSRKLFNH